MTSRWLFALFVLIVAHAPAAASLVSAQADQPSPRPKKPAISISASPMVSFAPSKIRFVVELKGGSDDYEDLYCPTVEWDWNDDTTSESTADCEPYVAGKSRIQRRFTVVHEYKIGGNYRVLFRLKKKSRVVITANITVVVNSGIGDAERSAARPAHAPSR